MRLGDRLKPMTIKISAWLGVSAVLGLCFVASCLMAAMALSDAGRGEFRNAYRWADRVTGKEKGVKPPERVNASFNVTYDENAPGAATFSGGAFTLALKAGFYPRPPAVEENKRPRFSYYISNPRRTAESASARTWRGSRGRIARLPGRRC